jgi:DNA (cytosine-5)-methyltransferase 1
MKKPIKIIDLFAGPGGLGEGFSAVGPDHNPTFKVVVSVEKEASAHKTLTLRAFTREFKNRKIPDEYYQYVRGQLTKNELIQKYPSEWAQANAETLGQPRALGEHNKTIYKAIGDALGDSKDPWVLIGGPPCQAYSLVGRARNTGKKDYVAKKDKRHFLYKEYLDIIREFKPSVFVMENVKGILSSTPSGTPIFEKILADLKKPGGKHFEYKIFSLSSAPQSYEGKNPVLNPRDFIIKSENYEVPQARHRVILVGVRSDIDVNVDDLILESKPHLSIEKVLSGLPVLRSGISKNDCPNRWKEIVEESLSKNQAHIQDLLTVGQVLEFPLTRGEKFTPLSTYPLSPDLPIALYKWLYDPNLLGVLDHQTRGHMESDIARYAFASLFGHQLGRSPRLSDFPDYLLPDHKNVKSNKFVDRFKVQLRSKPATTITSHISKDGHYFIHYDLHQCRSLTLREAARAQTFPDNYYFEGNRTQQYVQVGNAVPPFLARHIAGKVANLIRG